MRDIFILSYFTGLEYADVKKLTKRNIVIGIDSNKWINTKRTKTNTLSNIPILPAAANVIEKYTNYPDVLHSEKLLSVLSNQRMNTYIKEIADLCSFTKNLPFHFSRHTFATTVT
ncbi:MAG: hypothetical protein Q7T79_03350 [bacterium]|nr:hypothetical protein [bacterium]